MGEACKAPIDVDSDVDPPAGHWGRLARIGRNGYGDSMLSAKGLNRSRVRGAA